MESTSNNVDETEKSTECNSWYTLMVMSNFEDKVQKLLMKKKLDAKEKASEFFHEVLMPSQIVTEVKQGKKSSRVKKLYPGYLFVRMDLYNSESDLNGDAFYFVKQVNGVRGFIGGNSPTQLKRVEIEQIQDHIRQFQNKETPKHKLDIGQPVRILDGPFINFEGPVIEVDNELGKLKVEVSIFGRETPVELESWQVEKAEKDG
jgi:transcription termination/antitermination protein NusG